MLAKWFFEFMYRFSSPPWDTGITPPEVVTMIESGGVRHGRALDLGCGTGTNSIYLAQHGLQVIGVDFSAKAIERARAKSQQAGVSVNFFVSDVTQLDFLSPPFDLVLDVGCFHGLDARKRERYAENLARLVSPGGKFLLYAFGPTQTPSDRPFFRLGSVGVTPEQTRQIFEQGFDLYRLENGTDRGARPSAWYWFQKKGETNGDRAEG